jgi:hypothetical protein
MRPVVTCLRLRSPLLLPRMHRGRQEWLGLAAGGRAAPPKRTALPLLPAQPPL